MTERVDSVDSGIFNVEFVRGSDASVDFESATCGIWNTLGHPHNRHLWPDCVVGYQLGRWDVLVSEGSCLVEKISSELFDFIK
jgi:hypothetical protein